MDDRYIEFLKKNSIFYEPVDSNKHMFKDFYLDKTWTVNTIREWKYCIKNDEKLPSQGWKIHITSTVDQAQECLNKVLPYLVKKNISFKFVPSLEELLIKNSKYGDRASSGKFITIYPQNKDIFLELLPELEVLTSSLKKGPYILNDKQWYNSNVFFRYGAFKKMTTIVNGRRVFAIKSPDGKYLPDIRAPFYQVPGFIEEPERIKKMTVIQNDNFSKIDTSVFDKYNVESALHFSNAGGVYKAKYKDKFYVIKEGRSQAGLDQLNRDGFKRVNNEYHVLKKLKGKKYLVEAKEYFEIWENNYLVEEFLEGINLSDFIAQNFPFSSYQDRDKYAIQVKSILTQLKEALIDLHNSGYAMGDLQPSNVLISNSNKIKLIDFETATSLKEEYKPGLQTPGFVSQCVRSFEEADWFAYWRLVRFMFMPIGPVSDLSETVEKSQDISIRDYFGNDIFKFIQNMKIFINHRVNLSGFNSDNHLSSIQTSSINDVSTLINNLAKGIRKNIRYSSNQLIYGDIRQYTEHFGAYSIAYGGFGAIMALSRLGKLNDKDIKWCHQIGEQILKHMDRNTPVGLFNGVSGVACILYEIGEKKLAVELIKKIAVNDNKYDITLYSGLAGLGLSYLSFYKQTRQSYYLDQAVNVLNQLKEDFSNQVSIHSTEDSEIPYGLMHGWTGAAYFVFEMSKIINDSGYEHLAKEIFQSEIDKNVVKDKKTKTAQISDYSLGKERLIPYLGEGSIGLALVLNEFRKRNNAFRTKNYTDMLDNLCNVEKTFCCYSPGLIRGATGFLLLQLLTNKQVGEDSKYNLSILQNYLLQDIKNETIFCPGDYNYRISLDLFTGNAGVVLGLLGLKNSRWDAWIPTIQNQ